MSKGQAMLGWRLKRRKISQSLKETSELGLGANTLTAPSWGNTATHTQIQGDHNE